MREFWVSSGHLFLDRRADGRLRVTEDFLRLFLARPELLPLEEACAEERALHARLLDEPRAPIDTRRLADADAAANWEVFARFRDTLVAAASLEDGYLALVRPGAPRTAPLFLAQLVHVILRSALHGTKDAFLVRAAEAFFRPQRAAAHGGTVLLADADAIAVHERNRAASPLMAMLAKPAVAELAVLTPDNAGAYWGRSDAFDMALDLGGVPSGRAALGGVVALWVRHMLGLDMAVDAVDALADPDWRWFVGLDAAATAIGNALWHGEAAPGADQLLALYRARLPDAENVAPGMRGRAVTILLAADAEGLVRIKPQNLLTGLPLVEPAA